MTDYNDGEWHLWNGSFGCPAKVHHESLISYVWHYELTGECGVVNDVPALKVVWSRVLKFRVTKPHREPRVIWVNEYPKGYDDAYPTEEKARTNAGPYATRIAVRYVDAPE